MITLNQYEELLLIAARVAELHPHWRWGQSVFNVLHRLYPGTANIIRGTEKDMYYHNSRVESFKEFLK